MKKLSQHALRSMILEEISNTSKRKRVTGSSTLASFLFEDSEDASTDEAPDKSGQFTGEYKGDPVDKSTNVKDVDPVEIANQLLSGDDDSPIVQSSQGNWFAYDGAAAKAWIEKVGPDVFVSRLEALSAKVPTSGIPKSQMPFLPGPDDAAGTVAQVEDALTPGGELNIDMMEEAAIAKGLRYLIEKQAPPKPNEFTGHDPSLEKGAAADFLTGGLKDGNDTDDVVTIKKGGSIKADKAIPTQSNILIYKSMGFAVGGMAGGDLDAWAGTGGEILDGHHRWAATMLNDPGADMGTAGQVDLDATGDPKEMLMYLTALGNALGNATKTESRRSHSKDDLVMERWQRMAGLLK
tara:strand:- start:535 stop:1587 length:1053 start_codon:yes stop_codon:yes gene_type:complete